MMEGLAQRIMKKDAGAESVSLFWLGGAGFVFKYRDLVIGLDLYLSDSCRNDNGDFKRLVPPPVNAEDLELDYLISTHEHGDHLDTGSLSRLININTTTKLIGTGTVQKESLKLGISASRIIRLDRNESITLGQIKISAVFADHGNQSPDAIGVILELGGKRIYFTGDTCFRPDLHRLVPLNGDIDMLLVPINGKYGNPDSKDASYITAWVNPRTVIPCHYWLFKEHGGDPGEFAAVCREIAPGSNIAVLAIGEEFIID
jgi:L-ascorbate 6-phosphate lactonase